LDFGVEGEVGGGDPVDGELLGRGGGGEAEEAADVVVLVKGREKALGFIERERKRGEQDGLAELAGEREVAVDELVKGHVDGECSAGSGGRKEIGRRKFRNRI
jgi:hypothetical protein